MLQEDNVTAETDVYRIYLANNETCCEELYAQDCEKEILTAVRYGLTHQSNHNLIVIRF